MEGLQNLNCRSPFLQLCNPAILQFKNCRSFFAGVFRFVRGLARCEIVDVGDDIVRGVVIQGE